jgi:YwiC-like protein
MFPKEHGAYGQLVFPIATALAIGRPGLTAAALTGAAVFAFLAHEPVLVLLGQRGARAERERRGAAIAWFGAFASFALVCAGTVVATAPAWARSTMAGPVVFALFLAVVIVTGREHTAAGEVMSAITLASVAYPIGVLSSASFRASLSCAAAFAAAFTVGILSVHGVISFTRHPPAAGARVAAAITAVGALAAVYWLASERVLEIITPIAVAPASLAGLVLVLWPPSARRLRVVGWTLVTTSVLTSLALIAAFR